MKFSQPNITEEEITAVATALREGHLATGVKVREFEDAFKARFGHPYVVAVNSGTTALQLGLQALDVGPGDEVVVTAYSIMATVNCILSVGATPVFCDIDRDTYHLDPQQLPKRLTERTKAILPASLFGVPCDIKGIREQAPGIPILEDSIEALGASRLGLPVGRDVEIATFGFYPNKQITTCQGGLIVTADAKLADRVSRLRQHGYGEFGDLWGQGYGWNVRLPDPLAAMGTVQLSRLADMQQQLADAAAKLDEYFRLFRHQKVLAGDTASWFVYVIELPMGVDKRAFCDKMGPRARPYFNALHRVPHVSPYYRECPVADEVGSRTVALALHYELTSQDAEDIWAAFKEAI